MESVVNQSSIMERRKNYRFSSRIHIASIAISWVRLVCMVALIIMYFVMMNMGWIPEYLDFVSKYTFKDIDKYVPNRFVNVPLGIIYIRTILCVILLAGIHLKKPIYILIYLLNEMSIFISFIIFCVTYVSIYNLGKGNLVLGISQQLIGYTYIAYLFISFYILFRCGSELFSIICMAERSANSQSESIELATRN